METVRFRDRNGKIRIRDKHPGSATLSTTLICGLGSVRGSFHAARRLPDDGAAGGGREPGESGGHKVQKYRLSPQPGPPCQVRELPMSIEKGGAVLYRDFVTILRGAPMQEASDITKSETRSPLPQIIV
jgi:hypothetical protein